MENMKSSGSEVGNPEGDSFLVELDKYLFSPTQANVPTNDQRIESYRDQKLQSQLSIKHTVQSDLKRQSQGQNFSQNGTKYLQGNVEQICGNNAISHEWSSPGKTQYYSPLELQSQAGDCSQIERLNPQRSFQDNLPINSPSKEVYVNEENVIKVMPVLHSRSNLNLDYQNVEYIPSEWPLPTDNGLTEFQENLSSEGLQDICDTLPSDFAFDSDDNFEGKVFNPRSFVQKEMDTPTITNDDVRYDRAYTEAEAPKNFYSPAARTVTLEPPTIADQILGSRKRILEVEESKTFTENTLYGKAFKIDALDGKSKNTAVSNALRQRTDIEPAKPATGVFSPKPIDIQPTSTGLQPISCTPQIANLQLCILQEENRGASLAMPLQFNAPITFLIINPGPIQQTLTLGQPQPPVTQPAPNLLENPSPNVRNPMNDLECPLAHPYQSPCSTSSAPHSTQIRRSRTPVKARGNLQRIRPVMKKKANDNLVERVRSFSANPSFAAKYYRILKPFADFGFKLIRQDRMKCMDPRCSMQHMIPGVLENAAKNVQWHMPECRFFNARKPCIHCAQLNGECRGCAECI